MEGQFSQSTSVNGIKRPHSDIRADNLLTDVSMIKHLPFNPLINLSGLYLNKIKRPQVPAVLNKLIKNWLSLQVLVSPDWSFIYARHLRKQWIKSQLGWWLLNCLHARLLCSSCGTWNSEVVWFCWAGEDWLVVLPNIPVAISHRHWKDVAKFRGGVHWNSSSWQATIGGSYVPLCCSWVP